MSEEVKKEEAVASEVGKEFSKFLAEKGTKDEKDGKISTTLTLKNYREFLTSQGITKEILEKQAAVEAEVTDGINRYNGDTLSAKVKELVDAGKADEAKKAESSVTVTTPFGVRKVRTQSYRNYPVPGSDKKVDKTFIVTDDYKMSRSTDKNVVKSYEDNLKKLLGI